MANGETMTETQLDFEPTARQIYDTFLLSVPVSPSKVFFDRVSSTSLFRPRWTRSSATVER